MNDAPWSGNESLPLTLVQRVDAAWNRFERAWKEGRRPALEDCLADIHEAVRAALLRELIALDIDYRRLGGEDPQPEEYRARFCALSQSLSATSPYTPRPQGAGSLRRFAACSRLRGLGRVGPG